MRLETERLILSPWTMEDVEAIYHLYRDPQVREWLLMEGETSLEEQRTNLAAALERYAGYPEGCGFWGVRVKETGEAIGSLIVKPLRQDPSRIEIGWHFHSSSWGKGYATEAALVAQDYAFGFFEVLYAIVRPVNKRSARVVEKLGMEPIGIEVHSGCDHMVYQIETSRNS